MRGSELTLIKTWSEKPSFQFLVTKDSRFPLKRIVINQSQWKFQIFIIQLGIFVTKRDCYLYDMFAKFVPIRKLIEYSRFYLILCNNLYEGDNDLNLSIRTCLEFKRVHTLDITITIYSSKQKYILSNKQSF